MTHDPKSECAELILRFWRALDSNDYSQLLSLITPDCRWLRAGRWREGAADIAAALEERPQNLVVRHVIANSIVQVDSDAAEISYLLLAFSNRRGPDDKLPLTTGGPKLVLDYKATCVRRDGAWKLSQLAGATVFKAPD